MKKALYVLGGFLIALSIGWGSSYMTATRLLESIPGATTRLSGPLLVETYGTGTTCATATGEGDICVADALEVDGATDLDGTLAVASTTTLTGAVTLTGGVTGDVIATGKVDATNLYTDKVSLTLADMTGLRATNKTLVAAQGANTIIEPVSIVFKLNYGSAAFTESADNLELHFVGASGAIACTSSWLVQTADAYGYFTCDSLLTSTAAQSTNTALTLDNNGDGEFGGGTASTVDVWITYRVHDVS
jgi:cytoskeletal protein CcmA (bactofilin family)